ncbi:hypothetical protein OVA24_00835 [Luteolibacter sp. SL250]|uniref:hypothetical protein n=1 Tax=Luteolibacter sp. SL250 TaxID=2995170 RepID=UPI00226E2113|nr:hypothetical protein [Luteolibacter sp. SL250]WAC19922.1 hypothetical protein OVA24_00835 [Luteolibacter sp. SL250]
MIKKAALLLTLSTGLLSAQPVVPLIEDAQPSKGWSFNNGQEFGGGAKGGLEIDASAPRDGKPSLKLSADFTKAGMYVQAGKQFPKTAISGVSMWVKNPGSDRFTMRLIDGSGQCHQLALVTDASDGWQKIEFPIGEFFAKRGQSDAIPGVAKYESWGGAKDGKWHQPASAIYLLLGKTEKQPVRTLWLNEVSLLQTPPETLVKATASLSEGGSGAWNFTNGPEFKGAKGSLGDEDGAMKLSGDFTGGGAYVAAVKRLEDLAFKETSGFRLKYRSANASGIRIQLVDGTGETHQARVKITADNQWNDLEILPSKIAGGEHWGGAKDGKWHAPAKLISIALNSGAEKEPVILLKDITVEGTRASVVAEAFRADFAKAPWKTQGGVSVDGDRLKFSRTENEANQPATAASPSFKVTPGNWQVSLAVRSELKSPDSSYSGTVVLEVADASGKALENFTIADVYGPKPETEIQQAVELPKGAASARFVAQLNKTWGSFWIGNVSAGFLTPASGMPNAVTRILFSTAALGNLLKPEDPRTVAITVQAAKPLPKDHEITCVVRDYWGAEQMTPVKLKLTTGEKNTYTATLDLAQAPLEIGRYYEIEATSEQAGAKPFSHQTSFAILPESTNRQYKPEEVPFTARNWDNRIAEYIRLSDRVGIRIVGLWGGWSSKPPYKPELPRIDLVKELGLGWLTTTPAKFIEDGKRDYDETSLRQGVRNFINEFGGYRPMIINLGNEPHGTGERVKANVEAYRVLYDEIKKTDPTIPVVATSVEPNPEYFGLGYGKYCDAFDFHIYERPADVRRTMVKYKDLMKQHGVVKPLWSTELGLNSQGQTRHVVAVEVFKKTAAFFAEGGANMCWFGFLYPDPEGKSHGSSGDSHNLFDCRFNRYAPRLDAVAWYHTVNAVGIKKFVAEKTYDGGVQAFLFRDRDGKSLQFLWKESGDADLDIPLEGVGAVKLVRVDGTTSVLDAGGKALTLSLGADPILLVYDGGGELAATLGKGGTGFGEVPSSVSRAAETQIPVTLSSGVTTKVIVPPGWKTAGNLTLTPPATTAVRELPVTIVLEKDGRVSGELHRRIPVK